MEFFKKVCSIYQVLNTPYFCFFVLNRSLCKRMEQYEVLKKYGVFSTSIYGVMWRSMEFLLVESKKVWSFQYKYGEIWSSMELYVQYLVRHFLKKYGVFRKSMEYLGKVWSFLEMKISTKKRIEDLEKYGVVWSSFWEKRQKVWSIQ